jgi:hypothetical protein
MSFEKTIQNLQSSNEFVVNRAVGSIHKSTRKIVIHHLRKTGCRDEETAAGIFNDALVKFLITVKKGLFEGKDIQSTVAFLKQTAFFIWSKHSDNPKKEAMKRGQLLEAVPKSAHSAVKVMHDPMDGTENPAILGMSTERGSVESKINELKLSEKIKKIIGELSEECRERVRRMKFFHQEGEERITHEETATDFNDLSAKSSRKKQDGCLKKFKNLVVEAWSRDFELRGLIQLKI